MECLTDNRTRATTEIWTIVKKLEGKVLGPPFGAPATCPLFSAPPYT